MDIYNDNDLENLIQELCNKQKIAILMYKKGNIFEDDIKIENYEMYKNSVVFKDICFHCDVYLLQIVYLLRKYHKIDISSFKNKKFTLFFQACVFDNKFIIRKFLNQNLSDFIINLTECKFNGLVKIENMKIGTLELVFNDFLCEVGIDRTIFETLIIFSTRCKSILTITFCKFNKLDLSHINTKLSIRECLTKIFSLSRSRLQSVEVNQFETDRIDINHCYITKILVETALINTYCGFFSCEIKELNLINYNVRTQQINLVNVNVKTMNREAARIFKNEAYKANDIILATEYYVLEMNKYRKEVMHWSTASIYLLLTLNKWSNNYGKSWQRGLFFTTVCWIVFFSLFIGFRDGFGWHFIWSNPNYIKEAVSYLWLLDGLNEISKCEVVNWPMAIFFVLGKVMIAYGIYQTISAFRRFGK